MSLHFETIDLKYIVCGIQVAEVSIEALFQRAADKKIVEIVGAKGAATPKSGWFDFPEAPSKGCATPV